MNKEQPIKEYKHEKYPLFICQFESIGSTQTWAYENVDTLVSTQKLSPQNWVLVISDHMTSGVGSEDFKTGCSRSWHTAHGKNINATYVVLRRKPKCNNEILQDIGLYILSLSLTVCRVIEEFGVSNPKIKWVNDIFVRNKKMGGILCKQLDKNYTFDGIEYEPFVIGVGLNVLHQENELPVNVEHPATSLFLESTLNLSQIKISEILEKLHFEVIKCITCLNFLRLKDVEKPNNLIYNSKESILNDINARLLYRGNTVAVENYELDGNSIEMGIFDGIDFNGYAIIRSADSADQIKLSHGRIRPIN